MNKTFEKMISLVVALAMVMAMGLTAFAAEGDIKITFPTDAKYASHQYEVYQIFTGEVGEDGKTLKNLKYGENTKTATNIGQAVTAEDLATLTAITTTNEQEIIAAITPFASLSNPVTTLTSKNATYEGPAGYYLIKDKDRSQTGETADNDEKSYTLYILKVAGNVTIEPKASVPSVEKKVDDINDSTGAAEASQDSADYEIGDWVPFHLKATVASNVDDYKKYHLTFVDTLEAGKFDAVQNVVIKVDGKPINETFEGFSVVRNDIAGPSTSGFEIKLTFTPAGEGAVTLPAALANKNVTIDFEAKLGAGATIGQVGNVNTVKLRFSNNPNSTDDSEEAETPEDTVIVFTYKTIVDKVDPDGRSLKGAAFKLYKKYTADQLMKTGKTAADVKDHEGKAIAKYANTGKYSYVEVTGTTITDDTTSFEFDGLDDGDYVLVETKVPANFNAIDPIEFTVTGTHTKTADALDKTSHKDGEAYVLTGLTVSNKVLTASVAGSEIDKKDSTKHIAVSGEIYGEIINESGAQLPETGGMGTTLFYVFGAILVLGGGVVLISRRRMEA